eukprot:CAMPEP_0177617304 /NCGR_PEP_ID=MMETSP0419_2-20121207/24782_1 /TAXON_ID=582737 /ORGANISM="Tetraselmis sp., Strain GSL018" /LENGTH=149 /DNA_ID=CAMNT_0019115749 /DNA_START=88 /DNA_END=533 /DNA_ORIENTATION=-
MPGNLNNILSSISNSSSSDEVVQHNLDSLSQYLSSNEVLPSELGAIVGEAGVEALTNLHRFSKPAIVKTYMALISEAAIKLPTALPESSCSTHFLHVSLESTRSCHGSIRKASVDLLMSLAPILPCASKATVARIILGSLTFADPEEKV